MDKKILLIVMALSVMLSSCIYIDMYELRKPMVSGIEEAADNYASWIVVDNDGELQKYETILSYPHEQHNITSDLSVSDIAFKEVTTTEEKIDSATIDGITKYTTQVSYDFHFSEFVIPVVFTNETAVWRDISGQLEYPMPSVKIKNVTTDVSVERLQYEIIDGRVYETYSLSLTATDAKYGTSTTETKVYVKTFITIDDTYTEKEHKIFI